MNAVTDQEWLRLERADERADAIAAELPAKLIEALKVDPFCDRLRNWNGDTPRTAEYISARDVFRGTLAGKKGDDLEGGLLRMLGLLLKGEHGAAGLLAAQVAALMGDDYSTDQVDAIGLHHWE
jgi:hypothetical protein